MTNDVYLILFTATVMGSVRHPNVCMKLLKEIERHYKLCRKTWSESEGLITIGAKMQDYIFFNLGDFLCDSNLANKPY